jgi:predicted TIM-barrel fold metal-dependent hydrolase
MLDTGASGWLSGRYATPGRLSVRAGHAFAQALVRRAPEQLVWGSDWPHVNMNDRAMPNDGDLVICS